MFRKSLLKCLLPGVAIAGAMAITGGANATFVGLLLENKTDDAAQAQGLFVCNIYAVFSQAGDNITAVNSNSTTTDDPNGFHQENHPFGSNPDGPPISFEVTVNPNVIYDSFVTFGRKFTDVGPGGTDVLSFTPDWTDPGGGFQGGNTMLGGWFLSNPTTGQGLAGSYAQNPDGTYSILLAQLVVSKTAGIIGNWTIGFLAQGQTQGEFATVDFVHVPTPGALALLGMAGLLGVRRRRR